MRNLLEDLKGSPLTSVEFVHDYIQLGFDGPVFTVNATFWISLKGRNCKKGDLGYRDALCDRIERLVRHTAVVPADRIEIGFDDGTHLVISLKPEEQVGPEAAILMRSPGDVQVW